MEYKVPKWTDWGQRTVNTEVPTEAGFVGQGEKDSDDQGKEKVFYFIF